MNNQHLPHMQEMAIRDENGNCRCPRCGKYRKRSDFHKQSSAIYFDTGDVTGIVHIEPGCDCCLTAEKQEG